MSTGLEEVIYIVGDANLLEGLQLLCRSFLEEIVPHSQRQEFWTNSFLEAAGHAPESDELLKKSAFASARVSSSKTNVLQEVQFSSPRLPTASFSTKMPLKGQGSLYPNMPDS